MKQKLFSLLLAVAASVETISASTTEVDGIWYNFDDSNNTASVTYRGTTYDTWDNEYSDSVTIPASVFYNNKTYNVTSIGRYAFNGCKGLTSVTIPSSVTSIEKEAFYGCIGLISVTIEGDVTSIGNYAFYNCSSLTSIEIPNSVTSIGDYIFYGCKGLTSVTIGNDVTSIGKEAFYGCSSLTSIEIPNSVTSIGSSAFSNVVNITYGGSATGSPWGARNVNCYTAGWLVYRDSSKTELLACASTATGEMIIPNSVTSIGIQAFMNCTCLTSIEIPNSVTSIGDYIFYGCKGLTSVTIGNDVTSIGNYAFYNCSSLTSIEIPNSVTSIGRYAFNGCKGLTSVTIPNSVTSIGSGAFYDCKGLTSVTIGNNVTSIGSGAFDGCTGLISIYVACGDLNRIKQLLNNDNRVKYKPLPYTISATAQNGSISTNLDEVTICDEPLVTCTVTPKYGYHFTQWSDGNTDNPRTIELTQDTTLEALSAKNSYSLDVQPSDTEGGIVTGSGSFEYQTQVSISATSNYGYHFAKWIGTGIQNTITASQAYAIAKALTPGTTTTTQYTIIGYVTSKYGTYSNSYYLSDSPDVAGKFIAFKCTSSASVGNYVKVTGYLTNYQGTTPETSSGASLSRVTTSTDNPYFFELTQDITFTAEFAKNSYNLSAQSADIAMGNVSGGGSFEYLANCSITATAEYGYHFTQWSDGNTDNPRTIELTQDTTFEALFAKNPVITYLCDQTMGQIIGDTTLASTASGNVAFEAVPNYGYHFIQWSDGNKENPRTVILTQDTAFTAIFAIDKSGTCGENNVLKWEYEDQSKTLTISANGALTENYTFGIEAPTQMRNLIIGNEVTSIGDSAFYGMKTINHLTIGSNVSSIGDYAFAECKNFDDITCYASDVPTINATTFANIGNKQYIYLYVPEGRQRAYQRDTYWGEFDVQVKEAETITQPVTEVSITPADNSATVIWPTSEDANTYTLEISKVGEVFCTLIFNANGQLQGIAFAPGKNNQHQAPAAIMTSNGGLRFTVTGLDSSTNYHLTLYTKDSSDQVIASYTADFTTTGIATDIDEVTSSSYQGETKGKLILHNGQIFILRGDKTYTLQGQEIIVP